jgi:predicted XRE-type DNA-binding protein
MKMSKIVKGSMNVYADLGMADADEMLVKAQLATKIAEIIKLRKLTQMQASTLLGISQPKLSNMLRGRFRGISETKMLECLTLLGRDVQIVIRPATRTRRSGHVSVLFA